MDNILPEEDTGNLSTLQLVDLITHKMAMQGLVPPDVTLLRRRISEMEELQDQARNAVEKLSEAVDSNKRAVTLATQRYSAGLTDFLSVLDAQRSLYQAQDSFVLSDALVSQDLVALYKALGGGWRPDSDDALSPPTDTASRSSRS